MKTGCLNSVSITLIFLAAFILSSPLACYSEVSKSFITFPSLEQQLVSSIETNTDLQVAKKAISEYYNSNNVEMFKGFQLLIQEEVYAYWRSKNKDKKNYALTLLVHLLVNGEYLPNDTMTIALAVANNHIYSIADEQTRIHIKQDVIEHFDYYKKILAWQKKMDIKYDLSKVPVIPKVYWAHRLRNLDLFRKIDTLHIEQYNEFVDKIENLELMHNIVNNNLLAKTNSLVSMAQNIEQFTKKKLLYRAKIDQHRNKLRNHPDDKNANEAVSEFGKGKYLTDFMGRKRRWDLFYWLNYQVELYNQFGYFKGDCVTETTFQMNLYKAAGIPSMANQIRPVIKGGYSHNSPLFYNAFLNKWDSIQRPRKGVADYYVHFEKPVWHHFRHEKDGRKYKKKGRKIYSAYWQGEIASRKQIVHFRERGFEETHFEKLFLSDTTQQPGFIFNNWSAPDIISDTDNDGILDEFETGKNTDLMSADSDKDGFADLWEIEWGYNPTDRSSHPQNETIAIDGLSAREIKALKLNPVKDPSHDYKADSEIFDIASIAHKVLENKIYLAIRFHNDIRKNTRNIHTIRVSTESNEHLRRMAFQWVRGKIYTYEIKGKNWVRKECNQHDFSISTVEDTEMTIPLSLFKKDDILKIRYQATGRKDGKPKNNSDFSQVIIVNLKNSP